MSDYYGILRIIVDSTCKRFGYICNNDMEQIYFHRSTCHQGSFDKLLEVLDGIEMLGFPLSYNRTGSIIWLGIRDNVDIEVLRGLLRIHSRDLGITHIDSI